MLTQSLHDPCKLQAADFIIQAVNTCYPDAAAQPELQQACKRSEIYTRLVPPPNPEMGSLAFGCFQISKVLKKNPAQVAQELAAHLQTVEGRLFKAFSAQGPYLNFSYKAEQLGQQELEQILAGRYFQRALLQDHKKIMVEYSQPNTHKELHVGHMRNLCLGNSVVRLLRYSGNQVSAVTYPGDVGTHVAKCLWYLKKHVKTQPPTQRKGAWLGELYSKGHLLLEDQRGSDQEEKNRQELTAILKQLESKQGEYYQLWLETRPWSIELMEEVYKWTGVEFDHWFWESQMDSPSLEMARQLHKQGKLIESEGAIGMDLSDDKLGFCMLIKSDGTGLYATKDVMLAQKKFADYHLDYSLYIVDKRQTLHFQQVFKVLEKIGFAHAKDCHHLSYDFVELPDGAMSSRKGNIVPIMSLIDQMQATIISQHLEKYRGEWSEQEIKETAAMVANGAIKYGMLKMDTMRKIVFDMAEWLKLEGETGPYLQYVHARIAALLDKHPREAGQIDWGLAQSKQEEMLMAQLVRFNQAAAEAAIQFRPSLMCTYLYDLAKLFNAFYAECPIGKASDKKLQQMRLALSQATGAVMSKGLDLLGIPAPRRM